MRHSNTLVVVLLLIVGFQAAAPALRVIARNEPASKQHTIAVCDVWSIAYELNFTKRFEEQDKSIEEEEERATKRMREELEALRARLEQFRENDTNPDQNEEMRGLLDEYYELSDKIDEEEEKYSSKREDAFARSLRESVRVVHEAAAGIARERGFDYVLSSADIASSNKIRRLLDERRKADQEESDPDQEPESDEETLSYNDVFYVDRFQVVAVAPDATRIDDLVRTQLGMELAPRSE